MYRIPFDEIVGAKKTPDVEKINAQIVEEQKKDNPDNHKIMRLMEQKLMCDLFSNEFSPNNVKFRDPW